MSDWRFVLVLWCVVCLVCCSLCVLSVVVCWRCLLSGVWCAVCIVLWRFVCGVQSVLRVVGCAVFVRWCVGVLCVVVV